MGSIMLVSKTQRQEPEPYVQVPETQASAVAFMPRRFSPPQGLLPRSRTSRRPSLISLAAALLLALSGLAWADALDGVLEVSSAYVNFDHGVIQLYARVSTR